MVVKGVPQQQFERLLDNYAERVVPQIAIDAQAFVAKVVYRNIVQTTPVLTGLARGNWFLTVGEPSSQTTKKVFGGKSTGQPMTGDESAKLSTGIIKLKQQGLGHTFWIVNNLNYISLLDMGTSKKAPAGIVEVAINAGLEVAKVTGSP